MVLSIKLLLVSQLSYKKKLQKPNALSVSVILYWDTRITPLGHMQHMGVSWAHANIHMSGVRVLGRILGSVFLNETWR